MGVQSFSSELGPENVSGLVEVLIEQKARPATTEFREKFKAPSARGSGTSHRGCNGSEGRAAGFVRSAPPSATESPTLKPPIGGEGPAKLRKDPHPGAPPNWPGRAARGGGRGRGGGGSWKFSAAAPTPPRRAEQSPPRRPAQDTQPESSSQGRRAVSRGPRSPGRAPAGAPVPARPPSASGRGAARGRDREGKLGAYLRAPCAPRRAPGRRRTGRGGGPQAAPSRRGGPAVALTPGRRPSYLRRPLSAPRPGLAARPGGVAPSQRGGEGAGPGRGEPFATCSCCAPLAPAPAGAFSKPLAKPNRAGRGPGAQRGADDRGYVAPRPAGRQVW